MNNITACPLDCYDGCVIEYKNKEIKPSKSGYTNSFLCPLLNNYKNYKTIQKPRYMGKDISMQEALKILKEMIQKCQKQNILHYRGSGNFGLMQEVVDHFFASYGATLTDGSLCDGAGAAGITEGRGSNKNPSLKTIKESEVIVFWGRNPHTTSSHILPLLKNKKIIVIDPLKTQIAKTADIFVQIKPHYDMFLAMLLARFLYIQYDIDEEYLEKFGSEYEDFYELTQTIRIKSILQEADVSLGDIGRILDMVVGKKVVILCGVGVQKYNDGADILRAIDGFGVMLGLFGKRGCGVGYLAESKAGITSPFCRDTKMVCKVDTEFEKFDMVFVQCANILSQMPNTKRVEKSISKVKNVVYFGLYENQTSKIADLVIPAKSFLYKDDIRTSYFHNGLMPMGSVDCCDIGISEWDLSSYLCGEFGVELEPLQYYLDYFESFGVKNSDAELVVKGREEIPYQNGFDTDDGEFVFLEEFDMPKHQEGKMFLITPKSAKSLNSQFCVDQFVYINPSVGFDDGEMVDIHSSVGSVKLIVKHDEDIREDCVLIYSGTKGVNNLTTSKHLAQGKNATYQQEMVEIFNIE